MNALKQIPSPGRKKRGGQSRVMTFYIVRLAYRSIIFVMALAGYIYTCVHPESQILRESVTVIRIIWLIFAFEILLRFFPNQLESRGCQKMFARNFIPTGSRSARLKGRRRDALVLILWLCINTVFGMLHLAGVLDAGMMILICLAWSVGDLLCVLFYCPFQSLLMKNKCCVTCRIFPWDHAMAFAPLIFVPGIYTWSLLALAIILGVRWEIAIRLHPEQFSEATNGYLSCASCTDNLCRSKLYMPRR